MVRLTHNHPSSTFSVRNLAIGEAVCHQDVPWHPAAVAESSKTKARAGMVEEMTTALALVPGWGILAQ